jgi:hypothetical protein
MASQLAASQEGLSFIHFVPVSISRAARDLQGLAGLSLRTREPSLRMNEK